MMAAQGFFLLFLICCTAAVYAEGDVDDQEHPTDLPARAVFEVGKAKTHGMRYMKWKILVARVKKGEFGKRITCTTTNDDAPPLLKLYNNKGEQLATEDLAGLSSSDAMAVLEEYGFFPGDTSEPLPGSIEPTKSKNTSVGCGAKQEPKAVSDQLPAGQQLTIAELARAAATAATAAAKAATAAAAAAEAALAALAASNTGTCQG